MKEGTIVLIAAGTFLAGIAVASAMGRAQAAPSQDQYEDLYVPTCDEVSNPGCRAPGAHPMAQYYVNQYRAHAAQQAGHFAAPGGKPGCSCGGTCRGY